MYTVDDLRQQLVEETEGLAPRVTFARVKARAGRRRWRGPLTVAVAALAPALAVGTLVAMQPGAPRPAPGPTPSPTAHPFVGPALVTGLTVGDEELLLFHRAPDPNIRIDGESRAELRGALSDPSHERFRELRPVLVILPGSLTPRVVELPDGRGGVIDYGVVGVADARVEVAVDGRTVIANTARVPGVPDVTVFWISRDGPLAEPTGVPSGPASTAVLFTARDASGAVVGSTDQRQRGDGIQASPPPYPPDGEPDPGPAISVSPGTPTFRPPTVSPS
ncbi:hypothetical protein Val02_71130 [Virgisporangium aliadipatigenens]|uniref:Uncharacterized protein n=2 Tax=Virgisporangium aliadipatigenens TaxID=741659 RepID=A0A8J3YTK9_9ACTN|nr:hypothetical protein Val02_71130 [Virgisporangium aliadipatigenens]